MHVCTCNWDDGGNTIARQYLDANYAFPIHLGKGDAQGDRIHESGSLRVAVQGIRMVLLVPNHRHYAVAVAVAVPSLLLALSAVLTVAAVQHLQSEQIGFVLSTSCQGELVLVTSQQGMMWQM